VALRPLQSDRLVATFALGCLLLSHPLAALFDRGGMLFGVPLLYAYLFGAWGVLIALMALAVRAPPDAGP
jgi:hypothetical protein